MMRQIATAAVLLAAFGCASAPQARDVFPDKASLYAQRTDFFVIDVRTIEEYLSGHIEMSYSLPVDELDGRLTELPRRKDRPILLYCESGARSKRAARLLMAAGYTKVYTLVGGINSWRVAGHPVFN